MSTFRLCQITRRVATPIMLICGISSALLAVAFSTSVMAQEPSSFPETPLAEQEEGLPSGALFEKVSELIGNGEIRDAAAEIDRAVASPGENNTSADIHRSRRLVGMAFAKINNAREAWVEQKKLLDFELADLSDPISLGQVPITLVGLLQLSIPIDRKSETQDACEQAEKLVAALAGNGPVGPAREVLSKVRFVRASVLVQMAEADLALKILEDDRAQLATLVTANEGNRQVLGLYYRSLAQLTTQTKDFEKRDALLAEQQQIVTNEAKTQPENVVNAKQILNVIAARLQLQLAQEKSGDSGPAVKNPEVAMQLVIAGRAVFDELFAANPESEESMAPFKVQFENLANVVENQLKIPTLTGSKAIPLKVLTWINGEEISEADREGKVVLLDFWSAFIAPTPDVLGFHKSLQEKYGNQGLQIIGVTRYFNIRWNFSDKTPQRSEKPVPPAEENDALELFLENYGVSWPTMIVDDTKQLQENYAVSILPHCVLIDRQGTIRMIKAGFSKSIGEEIESTIKELLAEGN